MFCDGWARSVRRGTGRTRRARRSPWLCRTVVQLGKYVKGAVNMLDWGSVPVWIGALLTAGSVAIAARTYVLNSRRQLREQANCVVMRLVQINTGSVDDVVHEAVVTNYSDAPVWRVQVSVSRYGTTDTSDAEPIIPPGESFVYRTDPFWWRKFGGIDERRIVAETPRARVSFLDAAGFAWVRKGEDPIVPRPWSSKGSLSKGYLLRKKFIPAKVRHLFRDQWRGFVDNRPRRG